MKPLEIMETWEEFLLRVVGRGIIFLVVVLAILAIGQMLPAGSDDDEHIPATGPFGEQFE